MCRLNVAIGKDDFMLLTMLHSVQVIVDFLMESWQLVDMVE